MSELEHARIIARRRWGSATPFRLGSLAGQGIVRLANPYPTGTRGWVYFADGHSSGRRLGARERHDA